MKESRSSSNESIQISAEIEEKDELAVSPRVNHGPRTEDLRWGTSERSAYLFNHLIGGPVFNSCKNMVLIVTVGVLDHQRCS